MRGNIYTLDDCVRAKMTLICNLHSELRSGLQLAMVRNKIRYYSVGYRGNCLDSLHNILKISDDWLILCIIKLVN